MAKEYWLHKFTYPKDGEIRIDAVDGQPPSALNASLRKDRDTDELIGLIKGILADGVVCDKEASYLRTWFKSNPDVVKDFPAREIYLRLERILADGVLSDDERDDLKILFEKATGVDTSEPVVPGNPSTKALFEEPEPMIYFPGKSFSFTGKFVSGTRLWCAESTAKAGGVFHERPSSETHYLVIGVLGSRDWAHSSFGRKIEAAMKHRPPMRIVSERHWAANLPPAHT